jgi:hypothetical protein
MINYQFSYSLESLIPFVWKVAEVSAGVVVGFAPEVAT